jgi:hypothetical protein
VLVACVTVFKVYLFGSGGICVLLFLQNNPIPKRNAQRTILNGQFLNKDLPCGNGVIADLSI